MKSFGLSLQILCKYVRLLDNIFVKRWQILLNNSRQKRIIWVFLFLSAERLSKRLIMFSLFVNIIESFKRNKLISNFNYHKQSSVSTRTGIVDKKEVSVQKSVEIENRFNHYNDCLFWLFRNRFFH